MPFVVHREQPAGCGKRHMISHASEHIERFSLRRHRMADPISRHQRHVHAPRRRNLCLVARFLFTIHVPLDFRENIWTAENIDQPLKVFRRVAVRLRTRKRASPRPRVGLCLPLSPPPPPPPHPGPGAKQPPPQPPPFPPAPPAPPP